MTEFIKSSKSILSKDCTWFYQRKHVRKEQRKTMLAKVKQIFTAICDLNVTGNLKKDFGKRISKNEYEMVVQFIENPNSHMDQELRMLFVKLTSSLPNRINEKVFEIVLKFGKRFEKDDDSYWFAVMNVLDYGSKIEALDIVDSLVNDIISTTNDTWKNCCLLCILIQDYPRTKSRIIDLLSYETEKLYHKMCMGKCYTNSCYMVELIAQLGDKSLTEKRFQNFPFGCYANDAKCQEFLKPFYSSSNNLYNFQFFKITELLTSGSSNCQLLDSYLLVVLDHNDFAAPIEFNYMEITSPERIKSSVQFVATNTSKTTFIDFTIPSPSTVKIEFGSDMEAQSFVKSLKERTDRFYKNEKISVVQNYIALKGDEYSEEEVLYSDDIIHSQITREQHETDEFEESEALFGSPVTNNTTKDTSLSLKKKRSVSDIIATFPNGKVMRTESLELDPPWTDQDHNAKSQTEIENSSQDIKSFQKPDPVNTDVSKEEQDEVQIPETSQVLNSDVWDFEKDDQLDADTVTKRSKLPSELLMLSKPAPKITYSKKGVKNNMLRMLEKLNSNEKVYKINATPAIHPNESLTVENLNENSLSLSSPAAVAHRRASSRVLKNKEKPSDKPTTNKRGAHVEKRQSKKIKLDSPEDVLKSETTSETNSRSKRVQIKAAAEPDSLVKKTKKIPISVVKKGPARPPREKKVVTLSEIFKRTSETNDETVPSTQHSSKEEANSDITEQTEALKVPSPISSPKPVAKSTTEIAKEPKAALTETTTLPGSKILSDNEPIEPPNSKENNFEENVTLKNVTLLDIGQTLISNPTINDTLCENYTNNLQKVIYDSISSFSDQLIRKISIVNDEINKKVINDLTLKYDKLFKDLQESFQNDVNEMCLFIAEVKSMLNLPEDQIVEFMRKKRDEIKSSK